MQEKMSQYVDTEKKELKFQLKELEKRYLVQLAESEKKRIEEKQELENDLRNKYAFMLDALKKEVAELSEIRENGGT